MPYQAVSIPYRGLNIDSGFAALPPGFTSQCINVMPYDAFKGKVRIGQRKPLLGALDLQEAGVPKKVQAIVRADAYVGTPPNAILKQRCIMVAGGEVYLYDAGDLVALKLTRPSLSAMTATGHVGVAVLNNFCYFADGTYYRKVNLATATPTVQDWSPTQGPYAHVTASGGYANLLCRFGARLALAGLQGAPNAWFLSKLNDPDNWDPTGAAAPEKAVAGASTTKFGTPGEPIVALMPVGEGGLLLGCQKSMTYLTADPVVSDARLIELSRSVGVISTNAWCNSDSQTIYLMSQDGLYRVRPNDFQVTQANRVSANRLDSFFQSQNVQDLNCVLGYDTEAQNVYVILSRLDLPDSSRHLVYNQPTDSFWVWQTGWSAFRAPSCCGDFPTGTSRGSILAFGSSVGYIGWFDRTLVSGVDGQAATGFKSAGFAVNTTQAQAQKIVSEVMLGPVLNPTLAEVMMRDVRIELSMDEVIESPDILPAVSGPFARIQSGQTAEEAIGENIVSVNVAYDTVNPPVILDGNGADQANGTAGFTVYDCASTPAPTFTESIDLKFAIEPAPRRYNTTDTLIADTLARTYYSLDNRVFNANPVAGSNNWTVDFPDPYGIGYWEFASRDETYTNTSADTPGGTYVYSPAPALSLPNTITAPHLIVSSGTFQNANSVELGELLPGRNDALRCRVRDQAAYVRINSLGVPWALERMSVLVDPVTHTNNVKGTY